MAKPSPRFNHEAAPTHTGNPAVSGAEISFGVVSRARGMLLLCLSMLFVVALQFLTTSPLPDPLAVVSLHWNPASGKGFLAGSPGDSSWGALLGISSSAVYDPNYSSAHTRFLVSDHIQIKSPNLELEFSGSFSDVSLPVPELEFLNSRGQQIFEVMLPLRTKAPSPGAWKTYCIEIPEAHRGERRLALRLKVPPRPGTTDLLAVRGRAVFTDQPSFRSRTLGWIEKQPYLGMILPAVFGALLFLSLAPLLSQTVRDGSLSRFFFLLFLISFAVHFRASAFFHWDDWHVLKRFEALGLKGVIYRHNEHFLPLFFAAYFAEVKLFGETYFLYLLVSLLLHALNSLLVFQIFDRLFLTNKNLKNVAVLLALGYAVSSLHAETLHWAFETSLLLSETLTLWLTRYVLSSADSGGRRMGKIFLATLTGPLLFGNGFMLPAVVGMFSLFRFSTQSQKASRFDWKAVFRPVVSDVLAGIGGAGVCAFVYLLFTDGAGHGVEKASLLGNLKETLKYLCVGTQAGTVLRGLGLFPNLELVIHPYLPKMFLMTPARPELVLAYCGLTVSLCFLFLGGFKRNRWFWVLGQFYLILYLLLPALGRWQLGIHQSLALRYHSQMVFGLLLVIAPVLCRYYGRSVLLLSLLWLSVQTAMGIRFTYYSERGRDVQRAFAEAGVGGIGELTAGTPDPISPALTMRELLEIRGRLE